MDRGNNAAPPAAPRGASRASRRAGGRARRTATAFPLARRAASDSRSPGPGAHRAGMVAPHGRGHARLLSRRRCAGPPLLALPRGPVRAGRHPTMVRTRGVRMSLFAELAAVTNFSFLRGASHPHEIVGQAAELGLATIGIADRNTLAGVVRAH